MKFSDVQRAISIKEPIRRAVYDRYKALGGTVEWDHKDMACMANALTYAEDLIEYEGSRAKLILEARAKMKEARQGLEDYLNEKGFLWETTVGYSPTVQIRLGLTPTTLSPAPLLAT